MRSKKFGGTTHDWDWDMFIGPLHRRVDKSSFHEINFFIAWNFSIELSAPLLIFNLSGPRSWRGRGVHEVCRVVCEYLHQIRPIYLIEFQRTRLRRGRGRGGEGDREGGKGEGGNGEGGKGEGGKRRKWKPLLEIKFKDLSGRWILTIVERFIDIFAQPLQSPPCKH